MIQIHDLRLSFIWTETCLDLIRDVESPGTGIAPLAFLGRRPSYARRFEEALEGGNVPLDLEAPWPRPSGQYFWTYYLEGCTPGRVSGVRAWKALVPFRGEVPATVEAPWLQPGRLTLEGYFYPHGLALVVTASCRSALTPGEAVEKAFEIRRTKRYSVEWPSREGSDVLALDALASRALFELRRRSFLFAGVDDRSVTPFSVTTVVQGEGVDPGAQPQRGGKVQRMLEAVTTWWPTWRYDELPELENATLKIRRAPPSHVLYGHKRGRAVWFPALFTQKGGDLHSLSCYHRNLVLASLQVESLSGLVAVTAKQIDEGAWLAASHQECARRAAGILGRMYGGVATYKSWSPRVQIEQNDLVPVVNRVRDYLDMSPLS